MNLTFTPPYQWLNSKLNITVVGAGGTGSELMSMLFKMNFALTKLGHDGLEITLIDDDVVSPYNIGRVAFWESDIGQPKSKVLIERFNTFGATDWKYCVSKFKPEKLKIRETNLLLTCVDNPLSRAEIGEYFKHYFIENLLWGDCGNGSSKSQVVLGHLGKVSEENSIKLPNVFDLYPDLSTMPYEPKDSCSYDESFKQDFGINQRTASSLSNLLWQLLRHNEINHHGSFIDFKNGTEDPLKINKELWASFGYVTD
jgi:PRTRC genetic system ThiF family protein